MRTILSVFGTRPEAIKMAPVVHAIKDAGVFRNYVCVTGQHREMLDQMLGLFGIQPDVDLELMRPNQSLFDVTTGALGGLRWVIEESKPDVILVQGDTTTALAAAIAAFYTRTLLGHVEAGLRTHDKHSPFPEEINRRIISVLADLHFAPTEEAVANLVTEGVHKSTIVQTGNTAIDALLWMSERCRDKPGLRAHWGRRVPVLMTVHRRENFGEPIRKIFEAVRIFAAAHPELQFIYPLHPNPNVRSVAIEMLAPYRNVSLIEPLSYDELVFVLRACQFVLTDSGGLQEEAPTFSKPVLVLRDTTERPECVRAGCAALVGCDPGIILTHMEQLSDTNSPLYLAMSRGANPFGDGRAAQRIHLTLERALAAESTLGGRIAFSSTGAPVKVAAPAGIPAVAAILASHLVGEPATNVRHQAP